MFIIIKLLRFLTLYRWIWQDKRNKGELHKYLRRQGRKYAKRGSKNAGRGFIPNRVDIDQRPEIVEQKSDGLKTSSIIDLVKDSGTSPQTKNLNKLLTRI